MANMEERKVQITATMNVDGVLAGTETAKRAMYGMSESAKKESQQTSNAGKEMSKGFEDGAKATERQINSMISQIKRLTAEAQTAGGTTADRMRALADLKNVPRESIDPYLKQLDLAVAKQAETAKGMQNMGLSAKQMQAAMRGMPAQFTDIFTSLAAGQSPMLVMLQQGGQLKDMFGGLIPMLKAVASGLWAMVNPWTVAAAVATAFGVAIYKGISEQQALQRQLILTGNAAGTTAANLNAAAESISSFGVTRGKAAEALGMMLGSVKTGTEDLKNFTLAAIEFEKYGGTAVKETAKNFAELGKDPLKATMKLNEGMNYLSVAAYEQIRALEKVGKTQEAAKLAQEEYAKAVKERAEALKGTLGYMERGWNAIADAAKWAWDAMLGIGRAEDPLAKISDKIRDAQKALAMSEGRGNMTPSERERLKTQIEGWREEQRNLQEQYRMQQQLATLESARMRVIDARNEIDKKRTENLTNEQKMMRELVELENLRKAAKLEQKDVADIEAGIRKRYANKGASTGSEADADYMKDWVKAVEDWQKIGDKAQGTTDELSKSQLVLLKIVTDPRWDKQSAAFKETTFNLYNQAQAAEEAAEATKEYRKMWDKVQDGMYKGAVAFEKETDKLEEGTKELIKKTAQLGLNAKAQRELNIQEREAEILRLRALADSDMVLQDLEERERILKRIKALQDRNNAERSAGAAEDALEVAKDWERTAEQIEQSLTDALMKGFEEGKSFGESVAESLKNSFKTFTAKLIIEPVMGSMVRGAMGMFGIGLPQGPAGSPGIMGGGLESMFGNAASNIGMGALGGSIFSSAGAYGLMTGTSGAQAAMLASQTGVFGSAGLSMTGAASGTALGGAASALMAAAPYLAVAYLAYSTWRKNKKNHQPAQQNYSLLGMDDIWGGMPNIQSKSAYTDMLTPIQKMVDNTAKLLGGSSEGIGYGLYSSASPNGRGAQTVAGVWRDGQQMYYYDENADNASMEDRLKKQLPKLMLAGLQSADLPVLFKEYFAQFDVESATEETVNAITELASAAYTMGEAFKQLGGPFEQLSTMAVEARGALLDMVGGLDQFLGKSAGYFQNYYSEEERQALSLASVDKTLTGVGLDPDKLKTKGDFRAMLESIDPTTEQGARQFAAMLNSQEAFNFGVGLLEKTGMTLGEVTAGAPETAGIDLMVTSQATTNSLLERIEKAILETGSKPIVVDVNVSEPAEVSVWGGGASSSEN